MPLDSKSGLYPVFKKAAELNASDVHCMVGHVPVFRINDVLKPDTKFPAYTRATLEKYLDEMLSKEQRERYYREREFDRSLVLPDGERFRMNLFWEKGNPALAARYIPREIPSLDDLMAPEAVYDFVKRDMGLVLVTGPSGVGKSTLLASMIEEINLTTKRHILTLEDPIEFMYTSKESVIAQREYGSDFLSFEEGLKHVLRQDPDVILVGEMRNLETIAATITLAETGHLVLATLHTNNAPETIDRIVNAFLASEQQQIRLQLAMVLVGVISQILLPKVDGTLIAAHEVLVNNVAIGNLIRENKTNQIQNVLYSSPDEHMNTLDQELKWLLQEGFVTRETARAHARNPDMLD
jgi:twitching motility protein PilT